MAPKLLYWPVLITVALSELPLVPFWYMTLRADTNYWRMGCVHRTKLKYNPILHRLEVGLLQDSPDSVLSKDVQLLIEDNRNILIDFAFLKLSPNPIASGGFSRVFKGTYGGQNVAVKFFVRIQELSPDLVGMFGREVQIASRLSHQNVVHFYGMCVSPPTISLVMELCEGGSLHDFLLDHPNLSYMQVLTLALDCARAIAYCHQVGYMHRDIKSLNFLLSKDFHCKLSDFGLSRLLVSNSEKVEEEVRVSRGSGSGQSSRFSGNSKDNNNNNNNNNDNKQAAQKQQKHHQEQQEVVDSRASTVNSNLSRTLSGPPSRGSDALSSDNGTRAKTLGSVNGKSDTEVALGSVTSFDKRNVLTKRVGSELWMAPEMLRGAKYHYPADIYSLGVVFWELVSNGAIPYDDLTTKQIPISVTGGHRPVIPEGVPAQYKQLIERCWNDNPATRPTAQLIVKELESLLKQEIASQDVQ